MNTSLLPSEYRYYPRPFLDPHQSTPYDSTSISLQPPHHFTLTDPAHSHQISLGLLQLFKTPFIPSNPFPINLSTPLSPPPYLPPIHLYPPLSTKKTPPAAAIQHIRNRHRRERRHNHPPATILPQLHFPIVTTTLLTPLAARATYPCRRRLVFELGFGRYW
ncbi:hypothetical protein EX30DRAFT_343498 [Ascodesmis nigricans]|uniref:Uncharacterized protein n=1 Tax=Ascodesmis nigricans TaxID=341454 RepID=A0A4S2MM93_9PEZI|nr:hypothetical protein EX30DRAFT_343498 [Ascodesmis nigricans]